MEIVIKQQPVRYLSIDGIDYHYSTLLEVVEELEDTSYGFTSLVIYDDDIAKLLVSRNVCTQCSRGSYNRADGYDEFVRELEALSL